MVERTVRHSRRLQEAASPGRPAARIWLISSCRYSVPSVTSAEPSEIVFACPLPVARVSIR